MKKYLVQITVAALCLITVSTAAIAGSLDDYYLDQYGFISGTALQKALLFQDIQSDEIPHCGTPLKHSLQRDWNKLETATQKLLAKQVAAPTLSGQEITQNSPSGRFRIHYTTSGSDASTLAWVQTVAQTFDEVAVSYINLGWNLAPTVNSAPYDIYLRELSSLKLFGQAEATQSLPSAGFINAYASFIEIDNNFTEAIYQNTISGSLSSAQKALQCLQITAAHEYHHAIQYGYNYFFDIWYAEATSTWHEDELYDGVNQLYNYVNTWFTTSEDSNKITVTNSTLSLDTPVNITTGSGYGRWIFNRYLAEQHGTGVVKAAWEKLATINSPDGNSDISMVPVLESLLISPAYSSSLRADFFGFTKRVYRRDWTSHTADISRIHAYTPTATFNSYPADTTSTLAHYSFAFYKFTPSPTLFNLSIALNKTSGIHTALFKNLNGVISEIPANSDASYYVAGFGSLNSSTDEVVLLIVNATNVNDHKAAFSTSSTPPVVTEPSATSGGGGCFIATAAYGSYLDPQVQVLRDFRDTWLLTNAPGRAFVAVYYRLSPPIADVISRHETLKMLIRLLLTPVIFVISNFMLAILVAGSLLTAWHMRKTRLKAIQGATVV
jgi:hypothetical protein